MKRKLLSTLLVLLLLITAIGCQSQNAAPQQENADNKSNKEEPAQTKEKVLSIAQTYDITNLDPAKVNSVTDGQLTANLFDSLMFKDIESGKVVKGLAKEYSVSEDGLKYTFKLQEGVQFHKGYGELTSEDVKFTLDRIMNPETQSPKQKLLSSVKEVKAVDPYTVEIELNHVDPTLLDNLAQSWTGIVSKKAIEEKGDNFGKDPIGSGPFVFEEWKPNSNTTLVKNESWYRGKVNIDRLRFVPIPEPSTMYLSFENGDVDIIQITDPQRLKQYEGDDRFEIARVPGHIVRFIGLNNKIKPFDDVRVRKALLYGFDRKSLIDNVFQGLSTPAVGPIPPNVFGFEKDVAQYPYDPEKAKQLLAEAGYPNGFTVKMSVPNIDRFVIPATTFKEDMKKIGVKIELEILESSTYLAKTREGTLPLFSHSKGQSALPDLVLKSMFHTDSFAPGDNLTYYSNPDVDKWINEAGLTLDDTVRKELFSKIQKQIVEDVPYLFIDHEDMIFAVNKRVEGFIATPDRSLQVYTVDIKE